MFINYSDLSYLIWCVGVCENLDTLPTKVGVEFSALWTAVKNLQNNDGGSKEEPRQLKEEVRRLKAEVIPLTSEPLRVLPTPLPDTHTHTQMPDQQILNDSPMNPVMPPGRETQSKHKSLTISS